VQEVKQHVCVLKVFNKIEINTRKVFWQRKGAIRKFQNVASDPVYFTHLDTRCPALRSKSPGCQPLLSQWWGI